LHFTGDRAVQNGGVFGQSWSQGCQVVLAEETGSTQQTLPPRFSLIDVLEARTDAVAVEVDFDVLERFEKVELTADRRDHSGRETQSRGGETAVSRRSSQKPAIVTKVDREMSYGQEFDGSAVATVDFHERFPCHVDYILSTVNFAWIWLTT
jgi:hypothetical protein